MPHTEIHFAEPSDAPALTSLINAAFAVESFFKTGDRTNEAEVREHLARGRFMVAEDNGAFTGCIYIEIDGDRGYLGMLSVHPDRQRQGIGSRLTSAAEEFCRESGCRFADIVVVSVREELPPIYEKLGYRKTGTRPFPKQKETKLPCHFLLMSKELGHR